MIFEWVSHRDNFLLRQRADGLYEPHSDLVARVTVGPLQFRLVVAAESALLRRARPGRSRATLMRPKLEALPIRPRQKDDLYLMALHADGARGLAITRAYLYIRGWLIHPLTYTR